MAFTMIQVKVNRSCLSNLLKALINTKRPNTWVGNSLSWPELHTWPHSSMSANKLQSLRNCLCINSVLSGQTSSNAMTADPTTKVVRSPRSFSISPINSSLESGSMLYNFGMACAAVFLTKGLISTAESLIANWNFRKFYFVCEIQIHTCVQATIVLTRFCKKSPSSSKSWRFDREAFDSVEPLHGLHTAL